MTEDVPIRILTLVDANGEIVCDGIPQQLCDSLARFITYRNRLFFNVTGAIYPRDDGREGVCYEEIFCLRAGSAEITCGDDSSDVRF